MGYATAIITRQLLASLLLNYSDQIVIEYASLWSNDSDHYFIELKSKNLPEKNNGHLVIVIDVYNILFKQDSDV
jgi:hypothetical protein